MAKQNVVITGGAGFIGSHLIKYHLARGDHVWAVDSLQGGVLKNIEPFRSNPLFRFDHQDICTWSNRHEAMAWANKVYHMAASVGQKVVLKNPLNTLSNNIRVGEAVMEAMAEVKSKARLLIASTSEVYFHAKENPDGTISEDAAINFHSGKYLQEPYPLSKLVSEVMGLNYFHSHGIKCTIARIFNTIGTNQKSSYGMVVPSFIEQALAGKPITVYGDGLQSRCFTNVKDTVNSLNLLLDCPNAIGEIVNVGDDRECSIIELAELIRAETKSQSEIQFVSYNEAYGKDFIDVRKRCPDLRKLESLIGYHPRHNLEDTIKEIVYESS